jgi:hypothetical protein
MLGGFILKWRERERERERERVEERVEEKGRESVEGILQIVSKVEFYKFCGFLSLFVHFVCCCD